MGKKVEVDYECRLCGEHFKSTQHRKAFRKCPACKEPQNWSTAAPQPDWFPKFLPTRENGRSETVRWTNYALFSIFAGPMVLVVVVVIIVGLIGSALAGPKEYTIPNLRGMNLQSAQDCLQEHGFYNFEDWSLEGEYQIFDRNWVVLKQSKVGVTQDRSIEIIMQVVRATDTNSGSTFCPKP